jgi:hypothetical protein
VTIERTSDFEWDGVHEQIAAEHAGGYDGGYCDWLHQWEGVHEDWTLEHESGHVTQPEYELLPFWDDEQRCFVWAIREGDTRGSSLLPAGLV